MPRAFVAQEYLSALILNLESGYWRTLRNSNPHLNFARSSKYKVSFDSFKRSAYEISTYVIDPTYR